jgi:hypothetical protein
MLALFHLATLNSVDKFRGTHTMIDGFILEHGFPPKFQFGLIFYCCCISCDPSPLPVNPLNTDSSFFRFEMLV